MLDLEMVVWLVQRDGTRMPVLREVANSCFAFIHAHVHGCIDIDAEYSIGLCSTCDEKVDVRVGVEIRSRVNRKLSLKPWIVLIDKTHGKTRPPTRLPRY